MINISFEQGLGIIALYLSILGTYYMSKSFLSIAPLEILKALPGNQSIVHSLNDITDITKQRIESRIGIVLIVIGVIIQVIVLFLESSIKTQPILPLVLIIGFISIFIFLYLINFVCNRITKYKVDEANKMYMRDNMPTYSRLNGMTLNQTEFIKSCAIEYFSLHQDEEESQNQYLKRIYDFVGLEYSY